jgi:hypothetical protein
MAVSVQASAGVKIDDDFWLNMSGLGQRRSFESRLASDDSDSYWQLGAGLERVIAAGVGLDIRYAYARYSEESGDSDNIHRLASGITWRFGRVPSIPVVTRSRLPSQGDNTPLREKDVQLFRLYAPDANHVVLVADFNGWDPTVHPLCQAGGGWWELEIQLPAGSHQYAYIVDGKTISPPDAEVTVDDGFGEKNGLLRVLADDP